MISKTFKVTLLIFTIIAITLTSCDKQSAEAGNSGNVYVISDVSKASSGKVPDFTWNDSGNEIIFSEFTKGKVVFLNFWGTWCHPCRKEIPDIIEISKDLKGKDFVIIGIPLERDKSEDAMIKKVKAYADKSNIPYINVIDSKNKLATAFGGIQGVPTTYIVNSKGEVIERIVGMRDKAIFMTAIQKADPSLK